MADIKLDKGLQQIAERFQGEGTTADKVTDSARIAQSIEGVQQLGPPVTAMLFSQRLDPSVVGAREVFEIVARAFETDASSLRLQLTRFGDAVRSVGSASAIELEPLHTKHGKVFFHQGDITDSALQSDIILVPQWRTTQGGKRGGIAGSLQTRAQEIPDEALQNAMMRSLDRYDSLLSKSGGTFPPGHVIAAPTGILSSSQGPSYLMHIASVPDASFRWDSGKVSHDERMMFVEDKWDRLLIELAQVIELDPNLAAKKKIRVTVPALSTGGDGAIGLAEAGFIMRQKLEAFQEQNPNVEFVVALRNDGSSADFARGKSRFVGHFMGEMHDIKKPEPMDSNDLFGKALGSYTRAVPEGGATLNSAYVARKFVEWRSSFLDVVDKFDAGTLGDRTAARMQFPNIANAEAYSMVHKALEFPGTRAELTNKTYDALRDGIERGKVTRPQIEEALNSLEVLRNVEQQIRDAVDSGVWGTNNAFGGDAKMNEIIATAVGRYLLTRLNRSHADTDASLKESQVAAQRQISQLAEQLRLSEASLTSLRGDAVESLGELARLRSSNTDLRERLRDLETALRRERDSTTTIRTHASSYVRASTGGA